MANIKFKKSKNYISAVVVPVNDNVVRITGTTPNTNGFRLYMGENDQYPLDNGEYEAYTTLYREGDGWFELSNDGSVYVENVLAQEEGLTEEQQRIEDVLNQIDNLKKQLTSTDYQIIKTYEYSLVGLEAEYDINALHQERQNIRNRINELENQF